MLNMNGVCVLEIVCRLDQDVLFVFVFGIIGEEVVVNVIKFGVQDYVMKLDMLWFWYIMDCELWEVNNCREQCDVENMFKKFLQVIR